MGPVIRSTALLVVGLTGGIGSGKSTVARLLAAKGAVVIDTDAVAREVVEPGGPAYASVVERFGPRVVDAGGRLRRDALAALTFADPVARAHLNAIVHPAVEAVVADRLTALGATAGVVVLEVPLLVEAGWDRLVAVVVVVDCPEDVAVRRLVEYRGMDEADARRRIAAQATRAQRLAAADIVLDNQGSFDDLAQQVAVLWDRLLSAPPHRTGDG